MGNLGPVELIVIMGLALVFFGPKKLPEIGRSVGKALREFNKARSDFLETINTEIDRDEPDHTVSSSYPREYPNGDSYGGELPASTDGGSRLEYPEPLNPDEADALPYGGEFYAAEGDSQPSYRTAEPESAPAASAASTSAYSGSPDAGR
jgi:TatA/E family protein of Tat protein translocase